MNDIESSVISHYGDSELLARIHDGLKAAGADPNDIRASDLAPVEEFHIGGRKATEYLVEKMALNADDHVLDVGCGIGGAARYLASKNGHRVTGIDLTPEYISVARALTMQVGLHKTLDFETGSALAMPFENASFDAVMALHVAMNIPDRASLYAEIARVVKPGGILGIYDVMKANGTALSFPVPWAETAETSYVISPEATFDLLEDAGFTVFEIEDRTEFAIEFFRQSLAVQAKGLAPFGIHLLMGETAREKFTNVLTNIESGRIAPIQMLAKRGEKR